LDTASIWLLMLSLHLGCLKSAGNFEYSLTLIYTLICYSLAKLEKLLDAMQC